MAAGARQSCSRSTTTIRRRTTRCRWRVKTPNGRRSARSCGCACRDSRRQVLQAPWQGLQQRPGRRYRSTRRCRHIPCRWVCSPCHLLRRCKGPPTMTLATLPTQRLPRRQASRAHCRHRRPLCPARWQPVGGRLTSATLASSLRHPLVMVARRRWRPPMARLAASAAGQRI